MLLSVLLFFVRVALVLGVCSCFCYNVARERGLDPGPWAALGALLGPFGIPLVYLAQPPAPNSGRRSGGGSDHDPRPPALPRPPRRGPSSGARRPRVRMPKRVRTR